MLTAKSVFSLGVLKMAYAVMKGNDDDK